MLNETNCCCGSRHRNSSVYETHMPIETLAIIKQVEADEQLSCQE